MQKTALLLLYWQLKHAGDMLYKVNLVFIHRLLTRVTVTILVQRGRGVATGEVSTRYWKSLFTIKNGNKIQYKTKQQLLQSSEYRNWIRRHDLR